MQFLLDVSPKRLQERIQQHPEYVLGQLCTPLTNNNVADGVPFAIDNGAFSGFDREAFVRTLAKCEPVKDRCLFVAVPDVVANARRTLDAWRVWSEKLWDWPLAFVAQDGIEDLDIPWATMRAIFIGGSTEWKDSKAAHDVARAAKILGVHVHVGRVNERGRFNAYAKLGADTCDGTGICIFHDKLDVLVKRNAMPLLDTEPEWAGEVK